MRLRMRLIFVVFGSLLAVSLQAASGMAQEAAVRALFNDATAKHSDFALALSYTTGSGDTVVMTAGPVVRGGNVMASPNSRWHIGSITKSFTSSLVMRLVESGKVQLDQPIARYLPRYRDDMHENWKRLSLRHLLSHTAGLPANAPLALRQKTYQDDAYEGRRAVLSAMWNEPLGGKLGQFAYSNVGHVLAGLVVEEMMGVAWEYAVLSEIAKPLGLSSLGFGAPRGERDPREHRPVSGNLEPVAPESVAADNPAWMGPAGAIHLSIADLVHWGKVHRHACQGQRSDFLSQASCREMQTIHKAEYGLGWVIQQSENRERFIWHNGSNTMWYALLRLIPDKDIVMALATNVYAQEQLDELARALSEILLTNRP